MANGPNGRQVGESGSRQPGGPAGPDRSVEPELERARWLARFPEENPDPVIRVSTDGREVLYANPAAAALGVVPGRPTPAAIAEALRSLDGRSRPCCDLTLGERVYSFRVAPDGEAFNLYGHDVSEARAAARERDALLERLREADRRKDEFLAVLSHELRNPLAPIRNGLYILGRAPPGGEQARRALAVIERQVQQTTRLVDDLLDVTRVTRGKIRLHRDRLDLRTLASRTVEDHRELFARNGIALELHTPGDPVVVCADQTRVTQVLGNLLHNAAKFTPRGGRAEVVVRREGRWGAVAVRDDGTGIAPEVLPHLFEPFTQADRTLERSAGGLGLGLALVKGLVELQGGAVSAHSDGLNRGATFEIRLPLERRKAPRSRRRSDVSRQAARYRVLLVEDNVDAAESLRTVLELDGHAVETAYGGQEGIDKARALRPDVIVCDLGLPGVDGYQVARALRAGDDFRKVPLIALSGYGQPEDLERSRAAGFDLHLTKPVDPSGLEDAIARVRERALSGLLAPPDGRGAPGGPATADPSHLAERGSPVLVVDDDDDLRTTLAEILRDRGFEVREVGSGRAALDLIDVGLRPRLVLLGERMPDLDGGELFRRLRSRGLSSPVVLIASAPTAPELAARHGIPFYLGKPFDYDQLFGAIASASAEAGSPAP